MILSYNIRLRRCPEIKPRGGAKNGISAQRFLLRGDFRAIATKTKEFAGKRNV